MIEIEVIVRVNGKGKALGVRIGRRKEIPRVLEALKASILKELEISNVQRR